MSKEKKKPLEQKNPALLELMDIAAKSIGGPGVRAGDNICATCGIKVDFENDFDSELSKREWFISKMCQGCQDQMWPADENELDELDDMFSYPWGKKE